MDTTTYGFTGIRTHHFPSKNASLVTLEERFAAGYSISWLADLTPTQGRRLVQLIEEPERTTIHERYGAEPRRCKKSRKKETGSFQYHAYRDDAIALHVENNRVRLDARRGDQFALFEKLYQQSAFFVLRDLSEIKKLCSYRA